VEILDLDVTAEAAEEGANIDLDATRVGKSAVIKTSTRQTIFLPLIGLVDHEKLKPGDLIGVNKDSYLVLDTLPAEYDSRVKAMEVDEKPTEKYTDVGGLDKQIEELVEAVVWPMKEAERFKKIGIKAPKGTFMNHFDGECQLKFLQVLSCMVLPEPVRRFSPERVRLKRTLPSSSLPVHS
jgi:26S proteasome regulatory subunit T5